MTHSCAISVDQSGFVSLAVISPLCLVLIELILPCVEAISECAGGGVSDLLTYERQGLYLFRIVSWFSPCYL